MQCSSAVLDTEQLRDVTMNDRDLMHEVLRALVDDIARQLELLESVISEGNSQKCIRLGHYCRGACLNLGANRAAGLFKQIERYAAEGLFQECMQSLAGLAHELELLRSFARALE
jgi:HPt (histidine-containing phosphotransfer) domain-containing protein